MQCSRILVPLLAAFAGFVLRDLRAITSRPSPAPLKEASSQAPETTSATGDAPDVSEGPMFEPLSVMNDPEGSAWIQKTARVSGSAPAPMRKMHIVHQAALLAVQATERFCRERKVPYRMIDASLAVSNGNFVFEFTFEELEHVRPR